MSLMKHDDSDKTGGVRDLGHSCAGVGNGDNSGNDRGSVQTVFSTPHTSSQASDGGGGIHDSPV